jgi:hypothetical protein
MFSTIYVEGPLLSHPRVEAIVARYGHLPLVPIERYG